jgi:hypothetical protein
LSPSSSSPSQVLRFVPSDDSCLESCCRTGCTFSARLQSKLYLHRSQYMCEQPSSFRMIDWQHGQCRAPSRAIDSRVTASSSSSNSGCGDLYCWQVKPSCQVTLQQAQKRPVQLGHSTWGNPGVLSGSIVIPCEVQPVGQFQNSVRFRKIWRLCW